MAANTAQDIRIDRVLDNLDSGALHKVAASLRGLHPAEIAHLLESLPLEQRKIIWSVSDDRLDGEVLVHLAEDVRDDILSHMDRSEILSAAQNLDADDLADLINDLPLAVSSEILDSLDQQHRERLQSVLSYPEDTAGGLMNVDTITVRAEVTLDVVLRYLRRLKGRIPENTDSLYVVNRFGKYLGVLPLIATVTGDPDDSVAEAMTLDQHPIQATWDELEVANRFEQQDLVSAPVVDADGKLLGRITIDDVVDVIREEGERQLMGTAGLTEDEDMFAPVFDSARRRAIWLGVNLLTALLASFVIGLFENTLQQVVALAILMPIVASMGGIAGSQTLTLIIRGQALGQISVKNARQLLFKEMAIGAVNGMVWALVVGSIAAIWFDNYKIGFLIAAAMVINLVVAAFAGAMFPMLLKKMSIDPALAGGVLLTTVTDVVGFMAFLGLATIILL
ncbi:MAG: magnesium transporter [gamma proteobacterium symbiont of Bathyaustriella thionipta]|nr:magnesium transporter [gamma proteobacterium symbiont of Bathyaustriella thionipta]